MDRERKKTFFSFVQPKQYVHTLDMYSNSLAKRNIVCSVSSIQEELEELIIIVCDVAIASQHWINPIVAHNISVWIIQHRLLDR